MTIKLLECIELFSTHHIGTDEVTKSAPLKLCQLVYSVLGNRGFSKTFNEGEHLFIIKLRNLIVKTLINIKIQEPIVEYKWFENAEKVELVFMECPVDEDELDKIMVDICYFHLIGNNLKNNEKYQVITQESIVQTEVNSNNRVVF
ncbi:microtubule-associated protein 1a isoform x1 [Gigaspora margarita]|uniref:Microtubule-associated protein 1a isoform x1 n=1 Tax=Gigaspora margarita TaxID=4874 RepID=A0A8H4APE3_GIGMA|nr:microtubule-associated protein 1a isoform x1 [Gigaspora margarita]